METIMMLIARLNRMHQAMLVMPNTTAEQLAEMTSHLESLNHFICLTSGAVQLLVEASPPIDVNNAEWEAKRGVVLQQFTEHYCETLANHGCEFSVGGHG